MNQILLILRNLYLVFAAQELDGAVAIHLCFEGVGGALLLHDVDVVGNHAHADGLSHLEMLVVLNQKFATLVALGKCTPLKMDEVILPTNWACSVSVLTSMSSGLITTSTS